ncbi:helix-turn-helix domain-containing protein [Clostridium sp. MCC344]|mgnify:FL=1|nr:helix-turn-helix domain-containing protein [Clostridium sp. MCC344]MBT9788747.1 helix-turn-helix domain-containing protein [Clostridium sp. MCC344]
MLSYKPLFRLLLERDMSKTQLKNGVSLSPNVMSKLSKGEYVSMEVIERICKYLNCRIEDVVEILPDKDGE